MEKMTKEEILQDARINGVKYIRLEFTDMLGIVKNVEIPVSRLEEALDNKVMFDGSSIEGFVRIQEADMYLHPDTSTWLILNWENTAYGRVARLICDVYSADNKPFEGDPRFILKRNIAKLKSFGFDAFNVGIEPEFFLFKLDSEGKPTLNSNDRGGYFDLSPIDGAEDCRRDIALELEKIGFDVQAAHHEVAFGQNEITFRFDNALKVCDDFQTFKLVVKNIARRHGLYATFMPKPIANIAGSGMHINCSIKKDGKDIFYDENEDLELSKVAKQFIAGVLEHARGMSLITNPIINSYKRTIAGFEAPCYVSWSTSNRSTMIRIPSSRGEATRTEIRSVDPTANPYLALSVIIAAGLDGIERNLNVEEIKENLFELSEYEIAERGIKALPTDLKEAIQAFKEDALIQDSIGRHATLKLLEAKIKEWNEYSLTVHKWEIDRYLSMY